MPRFVGFVSPLCVLALVSPIACRAVAEDAPGQGGNAAETAEVGESVPAGEAPSAGPALPRDRRPPRAFDLAIALDAGFDRGGAAAATSSRATALLATFVVMHHDGRGRFVRAAVDPAQLVTGPGVDAPSPRGGARFGVVVGMDRRTVRVGGGAGAFVLRTSVPSVTYGVLGLAHVSFGLPASASATFTFGLGGGQGSAASGDSPRRIAWATEVALQFVVAAAQRAPLLRLSTRWFGVPHGAYGDLGGDLVLVHPTKRASRRPSVLLGYRFYTNRDDASLSFHGIRVGLELWSL